MRKLKDLESVGKAVIEDLKLLEITNVEELAKHNAQDLYDQLIIKTGKKHCICMLDTLKAAVEQAKDPNLNPEKKKWFYWSKVRKSKQ